MRSAQTSADRVALAFLALIVVAALLTFRDYGLGWDDYTHSQYGDLLLALYGSGFRDRRALDFVNLYEYGGGFDMAAALLAKLLPFGLFETRRLLGAAVGIAGLIVTWRLGRRLGGPPAGLLGLILLAACPLYYGHMFINAKDAPFAAAMALLLLAIVTALEQYPAPPRRTVVFLGLGIGLAMGTRILGAFGFFYGLAALILVAGIEARKTSLRLAAARAGRFVWACLPAALIGYVIMGLLWPWAVLAPLNPIRAATYFSEFFEKPWEELYEGKLIPVPQMPAAYALHLFALKLPEITLLLGVTGTIAALAAISRRDAFPQRRAAMLAVVLAAFLPVLVATVTHPAFYNGIRQFIFVVPPFAVLGGLGGAWLFQFASRHGSAARAAAIAIFIVALALPVSDIIRLHPFEYAAFDRTIGGVRGARSNYMLDYWGLSLKQASEELRAQLKLRNEQPPAGRKWLVAVCGPQRGPQVALGPQFETTAQSRGADFAMMLGEFYCRRLDAPILASVEREGVTFARVYDIRGRDISNLLTQPPPQ